MSDQDDPLLTWNRLNISNAERDLVVGLVSATLTASAVIDRFSSWLLAGIAATAALFITGIASILPYLSEVGFRRCAGLLIIAGLFGLLARQRALQVQMLLEQQRVLTAAMTAVMEEHEKSEEEIRGLAEERGLNLKTSIDLQRVGETFVSVFPKLLHPFASKKLGQGLSDPFWPQRVALSGFVFQSVYSGAQTFFFVLFMIVAVLYASAI